MKYISLSILSISILLSGCNNENNSNGKIQNIETELSDTLLSQGFQLLETNCFTCHSPNMSKGSRIAPPIFAVKKHYFDADITYDEFSESIVSFVLNPTDEKAKMRGAINKFGLMPNMGFSESQIKAVTYYLYYTEIETPDWFEKHYQEEHQKHTDNALEIPDLEKGQHKALAVKSVLGKNLMGKLKNDGTIAALAFCNINALSLTDSMAILQDAKIKRVSDKPRNEIAQANSNELDIIQTFKDSLMTSGNITPILLTEGNSKKGYYPILTNQMCLQCHGAIEKDINKETFEKINSLYTNDKAIGYGLNELRGMWVVEF